MIEDPITKEVTYTKIETTRTFGQLFCTLKDASECKISTVAMVDKSTGDFAAVFDNPSITQNEAPSIENSFVNNNFKRAAAPLLDEDVYIGDKKFNDVVKSRTGESSGFKWKSLDGGIRRL